MPLVVHPHFHRRYSGATRHVEDIVPALATRTETRVMGWLRNTGLPRISALELLQRARREPLVWHAHRVHELLVGLAVKAWGRNVRLIWTRHSTGRPSRFTRLVVRHADQIVSVSQESAETLGVASTTIGHGVDLTRFHPPADRAAAWEALKLGGRFGICVVGRVRPDKGQGDFVTAAAPLLAAHPEWRSALVGLAKPKDRTWIDGVIAASGSTGVSLVGERDDVERWFQGASIAVVPSHLESFGLTRLEAMAAGCCLITTRLNSLDREIEHGRTGFLYDAGDVGALRALLEPLLREPERARTIGENAAELARSRFGIAGEAEALLSAYGSAALQ